MRVGRRHCQWRHPRLRLSDCSKLHVVTSIVEVFVKIEDDRTTADVITKRKSPSRPYEGDTGLGHVMVRPS